MSWWNRLLGRGAEAQPSKTTFPVRAELIPGSLTVTVYLHSVDTPGGPISCWSYVTDGLIAHHQKEVVFTLRRDRNERVDDFPQEPFQLFITFHQLAQQEKVVDEGGFTQFGARDFLGHHLMYVHPQPLPGVEIPANAILALLVTKDEVLAVQEFGSTRVIARLGEASRHYPCPIWSDRLRPGISFESTRQNSTLMRVSRAKVPGVRIIQTRGQLTLSCNRKTVKQFENKFLKLPTNIPLALLTELDPEADGCLVWQPGQSGPAAITPPGGKGSCLSGSFVLLVPEQPRDGGQILEDGFALTLTEASYTAIRQALSQGQAITVPSTNGGLSLSITWWEEEYHNPIDEKTYVAPQGWHTYRPETRNEPNQETKKRKCAGTIRLLTVQDEIATRTSVENMAAFCNTVMRLADHCFDKCDGGFEVLVQFKCTPSGHEIRMTHKGDASQELLQAFYDALNSMEKLVVSQDEVTFQVDFVVSS